MHALPVSSVGHELQHVTLFLFEACGPSSEWLNQQLEAFDVVLMQNRLLQKKQLQGIQVKA